MEKDIMTCELKKVNRDVLGLVCIALLDILKSMKVNLQDMIKNVQEHRGKLENELPEPLVRDRHHRYPWLKSQKWWVQRKTQML